MKYSNETRPPYPPFTRQEVRMAEDAWNGGDPQRVLAYSVDSLWRKRPQFLNGREAVMQFLVRSARRTGSPAIA